MSRDPWNVPEEWGSLYKGAPQENPCQFVSVGTTSSPPSLPCHKARYVVLSPFSFKRGTCGYIYSVVLESFKTELFEVYYLEMLEFNEFHELIQLLICRFYLFI